MALKSVFKTKGAGSKQLPITDTVTAHGTPAYKLGDRHALAQFAATGTMASTYYATAEEQLDKVLDLAKNVDSDFLLKTAVYSRKKSFMKDMPALLLAVVAARGDTGTDFRSAFVRVIDNGRMLRNFVQIIRSGKLGRTSFGTSVKKCIQRYLESRTNEQLFKDSIGNDPSLADIIKMVHPAPSTETRNALYGYLLGKEHSKKNLPTIVKQFEAFKKGEPGDRSVPEVDFRMLSSLNLTDSEWVEVGLQLPWQALRMNLNTLARHGVFKEAKVTKALATALRDPDAIKKARVFPYQLMMAYRATATAYGSNVPPVIVDALQDALDISLDNVLELPGNVVVAVDVSGSMAQSVTGSGPNASKVTNVEVAALIAAALVRKNRQTVVLPFAANVKPTKVNSRDSVMTNAQTLASLIGGGTNCSAPLETVLTSRLPVDTFIFVSDNESWLDNRHSPSGQNYTNVMENWNQVKRLNPNAKLVCIDISPNGHTQARERKDVLNIGGFSDNVFEVLGAFVNGTLDSGHWVSIINGTVL